MISCLLTLVIDHLYCYDAAHFTAEIDKLITD